MRRSSGVGRRVVIGRWRIMVFRCRCKEDLLLQVKESLDVGLTAVNHLDSAPEGIRDMVKHLLFRVFELL